MTHLLGRQDCVESLRRDLIDLQGAVLDVFSRTGPVRFPSWKFPDKLSCNLDLVSLLEQYDYADGEEEFNQHSHIVLLELVIDRLMLLLQCFEAHAELALGGQRRHLRSCQSGASVSLGPVVKHYWNTLVRLSSQGPCTDVSRGSPGERRAPVRASCDAESTCPQGPGDPALRPGDPALRPGDPALRLGDPALRPGNPALRPGDPALRPGDPALRHSAGTALSAPKTRAAPGAPPSDPHRPALSAVSSTQHRSAPSTLTGPSNTPYTAQHAPPNSCPPPVSSCVRSVGSQTVASCLVPCQACALVQDGLRETGAALVAACCTLGLPCSLQRLLVAVDDSGQLGRLVAADVSQWASEQSRDMSRLTKHTLEVRGTVEPLKERLRGAEMEREELRRRLEREEEAGRREREQRRRREEELELRLQEEKRSREEERRRRQEEQDELRRGAASLQDRNSGLAAELGLQRETLHSLECERDALREEVRRLRLEEVTRVQEVEERRRGLEAEVDSTRLQLDKESAKYHSALRQQQAMQGKQQAVCERVEALTEECEDLQSRLDERDELTHTLSQERDTLQQQLMQQQEECVRLQARAAELEGRVCELGAELRQAVQRERLLVAFPELSQPSLPQSTGDVLSDMDQQLQSNSVRIKVLQQENTVLMTSLARLRQQESHPPSERQQRVTPSTGSGVCEGGEERRGGVCEGGEERRGGVCEGGEERRGGVCEGGEEGRAAAVMVPWTAPSSSSSSSALHHLSLRLSLSPHAVDAHAGTRRSRSTAARHWRK